MRRRKKKASTEVAVVAPSRAVVATAGRISKLKNVKKMRSILGDQAESIQQLLEAGNNDSATMMLHKTMLQALIDLVPHAESNVRRSKGARGVYQINSLISSIREILIDIQGVHDKGAIGETLVDRVVRPCFLDLGMVIVQEYATILSDARGSMSSDEFKAFKTAVEASRGRVAAHIQKEFGRVKSESIQFLQR